jgi:DNA-binding beta-propeller fold protein YncE
MTLFLTNSGQTRKRLVQAGAVFAAVALVAGCGSVYRAVVTPIGNSGPEPQPSGYAIVVSAPSPTTPGIATIIDYSGDSVLAYANIGPGPSLVSVNYSSTAGYTLNSDGTLSNFPVSPQLQAKQVSFTTLNSTSQPGPPHPPVNMFSTSGGIWAADLNGNYADIFSSSTGVQAFDLAIPVATTPVFIVGPAVSGLRNYVISQDFDDPTGVACNISPTTAPVNGEADGILISTLTRTSQIVLDPANPTNSPTGSKNGMCPVYAVQSPDNRRFFVMNRGSDTITVINSQDDTLDNQCPTGCVNQDNQKYYTHPILPLSTTALASTGVVPPNCNIGADPTCGGMTAIAGPVYAEYNAATSQLIVANYDGGTISVIDVSEDVYGNDSPTFGTTYTIPVGKNPASVTVLTDGTRAYTANQTDQTATIVNLSSHTVEKTLPVTGHPRTVVSAQNSQFGKVYVASPDSPYITIIRTDLDIIDTTILVEGNVVDVRVSSQTLLSGNLNETSRSPGHGQPCNLPPSLETVSPLTLAACQAQP